MPLGQKKTKRQFKPKKKEAQVEAKIEPEPEFVANEANDKKKRKGPPEKKQRLKPQRYAFLLYRSPKKFILEKLFRQNQSSRPKASKEGDTAAKVASDQAAVAAEEASEEQLEKIFKLERRLSREIAKSGRSRR